MIKLSSLCHNQIQVEFPDPAAHIKEPLCTLSFRCPTPQPKPEYEAPITYGYVKDI